MNRFVVRVCLGCVKCALINPYIKLLQFTNVFFFPLRKIKSEFRKVNSWYWLAKKLIFTWGMLKVFHRCFFRLNMYWKWKDTIIKLTLLHPLFTICKSISNNNKLYDKKKIHKRLLQNVKLYKSWSCLTLIIQNIWIHKSLTYFYILKQKYKINTLLNQYKWIHFKYFLCSTNQQMTY